MYITYPFHLIKRVLNASEGSIFIVSSNTFYAPLIVKIFSSKNIKVVNLIYDLFPDAIEVAGKISPNSLISKIIGKIIKINLEKSTANVFLGNTLKDYALQRWSPNNTKINKAIHISSDYSLFENQLTTEKSNTKIIFHYGGQLGHLHDADGIISLVNLVGSNFEPHSFGFNFNVSGANASYLENSLKEKEIEFEGAIPSQLWREKIMSYQIGIVSLSPGGATVCLPSKTYAMMGGGLAIIAICPIWSDLAKLVLSIDGGWVINNSFYSSLDQIPKENFTHEIKRLKCPKQMENEMLKVLETIFSEDDLVLSKRQNAYYGVRNKYGLDKVSNEWGDLISSF